MQTKRGVDPKQRRGAYAMLTALMITAIMGFGALAIDVSWMRLTQAQAQGIADAVSQAALLELRASGRTDLATAVGDLVASKNTIGTKSGFVSQLEFGRWDHTLETPYLDVASDSPNAVRATVTPTGSDMNFMLAPVIGFFSFEVEAKATTASRCVTLNVIQDSTHSWAKRDYDNARNAVLALLDTVTNSYGPDDKLGLVSFNWAFGVEYTPFTPIDAIDGGAASHVWTDWENLNEFTWAGRNRRGTCRQHRGRRANNFNRPRGGCFPTQPRAYDDEWGTDHSVGLGMSQIMFRDLANAQTMQCFNAQIIITDGKPNYLPAGGGDRADDGYVETRWRQYEGPHPRWTYNEIRTDALDKSDTMWVEDRVHTYVVSFVAHDDLLDEMTSGQGYYVMTDNSAELIDMVQSVLEQIPYALVE